jgi:hypothetical protein
MEWKRLPPIAVLVLSVAFVGLGLVFLIDPQIEFGCYDPSAASRAGVDLCGIGVAGMAFLAWLKR